MRFLRPLLIIALLPIAACNGTSATDDGTAASSSSAASQAASSMPAPTQNVSYTGVIQPAGISVFQQGTHRLLLPGNHFILLQSSDINLDTYLNQRVEAFGSVQPTVEAGGTIMTVARITPLETTTGSGSAASAASDASSAATVSAASSADAMMASSSSEAMTASSEASTTSSALPTVNRTAAMEERIAAIAAEDLSPGRWTQQYCSSHMGFCTPIHKNWWFKSFGATSSALWHVEISNAPIDLLGDGPIAINVVSGTLASRSATDGQVRVQGDLVLGFRARDDESHFEVVAPAELEASVQYVTKNIVKYAGE